MPQFANVLQKTFIRGINASTDSFNQPRGSIPRSSNLVYTKRGALMTCDGSAIVNAFNGTPTAGRGKDMCSFLYAPVGVARYYLRLMKGLSLPLGAPNALVIADGGAGGTLAAATYFYKVTALDNVGGETLASSEVSRVTPLNGKNLLTWNIVPNAVKYNIYRSTTTGTEGLLAAVNLPISQPAAGTLTVSYTDDGTAASATSVYSLLASPNGVRSVHAQGGTTYDFTTSAPPVAAQVGRPFTVAGCSLAPANTSFTVQNVNGNIVTAFKPGPGPTATGGGGTLTVSVAPPAADTTQQVALYKMPAAAGGIPYTDADVVALFPADPPALDGDIGGGGGGGGGTGGPPPPPGGGGQAGSTPSGGMPGNLTFIPQIVQFVNQAVLALGNGFRPQLYRDATGTTVNSAPTSSISAISVDAAGVVTVTTTTAHQIATTQVGACVRLAGVTDSAYNGIFVVISVVDATHFKVRNLAAIGHAASSGGSVTITTVPIINTFTALYPSWTTATPYLADDLVRPTVSNGHYYKAVQGGVSGAAQPTFPTGTGQRVTDGNIIWQEAGNDSVSPAPPGAAHIAVHAGALWVFDTSPSNTADGLDGPTVLRMSDVNNPNSWNPINAAFIDKDDGTEGMGLASYTITAEGIPPQGSLVLFKLYSTYQVVGIFGAPDFAIQRVATEMGCMAPRTIQFLPGFGLGRITHLGIAVFDGVRDKLISEEIRPFLFPLNDLGFEDIVVADASWLPVAWGSLVANPPMYAVAIPIGDSGGALTRLLLYDLVMRAWAIEDLPFPISTMFQARPVTSNPITLVGSFSDGTLQRIHAGDQQWATSAAGSPTPASVLWAVITPEVFNPRAQTGRMYYRQLVIRGRHNSADAAMSVAVALQDEAPLDLDGNHYDLTEDAQHGFELIVPIGEKAISAHAVISGQGDAELDSFDWFVQPLPTAVPVSI